VFAGVEGAGEVKALVRKVERAAHRSAGVDRRSVRVSAHPAAISFALDPGVAVPEQAVADIARSAGGAGVRLEVLRVAR
jgi:hypothetical protein